MKKLSTKLSVFSTLLIAILALCQPVFGQSSGGGTVRGTVKDSSGGMIQGANITIDHIEGGRVVTSVSNQEGGFVTPAIPIGKYKIRIQSSGMKSWEGDLVIETARTTEVNATLTLGEVTETIVVQGSITPLVSSSDPTDGSTLDRARISELPVDGRDLNRLISDVTPGLELIGGLGLTSVRASGLMEYSTDFTVDGSAANSRELGRAGLLPGLDSIGEVRVETSTSSAKYNRPTSVSITTRGGSNKFHGSLFETNRNNAYGTARARQDVLWEGDYKAPKLIRNEYGGTISGPVFLPSFGMNGRKFYNGKDKSFFFFSREYLNYRGFQTREFRVPTAAMREGDFSTIKDSAGNKLIIYDPQLTKPRERTLNGKKVTEYYRPVFPGNQIPLDRISPLAKYIFSITPLPNDGVNPFEAPNLKMAVPTTGNPVIDRAMTTVRIDHRFTDKDSLYFRVYGGDQPSNYMGTSAQSNAVPTLHDETNKTYVDYKGITGTLNWTHVFSPSFSVETMLSRQWIAWKLRTGIDTDKNWSDELGLPNPYGEIGWPAMTNLGLTGYSFIEGDTRRQVAGAVTTLEQNYSLLRGSHNFQFGFKYTRYKDHVLLDQGAISGAASFDSLTTALHDYTKGTATSPVAVVGSGSNLANFFLGHAESYNVALKRNWMRMSQQNPALYFQDTFKVTQRLTLTPGVRWDFSPAFKEQNHLFNSFDVKSHSIILDKPLEYYYQIGATSPEAVKRFQDIGVKFATAEQVGRKNVIPSNLFDIGPRAGFAYRLFDDNKSLILRGGYGIYFAPLPMRTLTGEFGSMAPFRIGYTYSPNASALSPDGTANYLLRKIPAVVAGVNSENLIDVNNPNSLSRGISVRGLADELPSTKIHEWNLTIEKLITKNMVFRVSYKGKHGVNTDQFVELNPQASDYVWYKLTDGEAIPKGPYENVIRRLYDKEAYTSVRLFQKSGYINTSMFSFEFERRFSKGLGFQAFYSLTNALRMAGNFQRDDIGSRPEIYLPGTVPTDEYSLNRFLFYDRDDSIPKHRIRWNWSYELPFGKGKHFLTKGKGMWNGLFGNWKLSGSGSLLSTWYSMPTNQWGEIGKFEVYGKKHQILDCRPTSDDATSSSQERCYPGYLWFNGYISARDIQRYTTAGVRNGVFGLPADYKPAQKPVNAWPEGGSKYADKNLVPIKLKNGSTVDLDPNTGVHPWRNQYLLGPFNWMMNASIMKSFPIKERVRLRLAIDVFNVFNTQGLNAPEDDGIASKRNSYSGSNFTPRRTQIGLRLDW